MAAGECSGDWPSSDNWAAPLAAPISDQRSLRQPITCLYSTRRAPHVYWFIVLHRATRLIGSANHRCKTTHDSTPVHLDMVRMTPKRTTWRMDLRQLTVYEHFAWVNMWTKVHHVAWKSFMRIFPLAPKLWRLIRWILENFKFSRSRVFLGGPLPHLSVRYQGLVNL